MGFVEYLYQVLFFRFSGWELYFFKLDYSTTLGWVHEGPDLETIMFIQQKKTRLTLKGQPDLGVFWIM